MPKEICGATFGDLVAVDDMHQRKAEMARRADAFIALPGILHMSHIKYFQCMLHIHCRKNFQLHQEKTFSLFTIMWQVDLAHLRRCWKS